MKISVITAAYKSKSTVGDSIKSIAVQTHQDIEHLVIEGDSKDGTLEAIKVAFHNRMRLISEPDGGVYDALNKGLRSATGDVIGFMHSDDFLSHDGALAQVASAFEDPAVEAVYSDLEYVSKIDKMNVIRHWSSGAFHPSRLKYGWMPAHPTLYLRREVYERFGLYDQNMLISADYDFILRYFSKSPNNSIYIPEVLYKMRAGGASNRNFFNLVLKMKEDMIAIRRNRTGGFYTLIIKNLSKIGQFYVRFRRKI